MRLEEQVCSLELAQKLKTSGVKQDSLFYWVKSFNDNVWEIVGCGLESYGPKRSAWSVDDFDADHRISAFTSSELWQKLPTNKVQILKWFDFYYCEAWDDVVDKTGPMIRFTDKRDVDSMAKMLLHLIEKGIVNP